jgi:hypothetical protein
VCMISSDDTGEPCRIYPPPILWRHDVENSYGMGKVCGQRPTAAGVHGVHVGCSEQHYHGVPLDDVDRIV